MPNTVLILVRHGATRANVVRPYILQGARPDSELIEDGVAQAMAAAGALQSFPMVRAYSSPLKRAEWTARLMADTLEIPVQIDDALIETDIGEWTGLTWDEIDRRWPEEHRAFHEDPERHGYPGGENLSQVRNRVLPAIEALVARHLGETFLVVGHGIVNRVLLAHWLGLPLRYARALPQDNGAYTVLEFRNDKPKVRAMNVTASQVPASCGDLTA